MLNINIGTARSIKYQLMANGQWLIAKSTLSHPDYHRRYRNFTDSVLFGRLSGLYCAKLLINNTFEESRTITAGRELHPAPSISTAKIIKKENEELKIEKKL